VREYVQPPAEIYFPATPGTSKDDLDLTPAVGLSSTPMPFNTCAGMYIIPLLTSVLHDESQWEKPHEFYPEHFLDSEGKFVKRARIHAIFCRSEYVQRFIFQPPSGTSKDDLDLTPVVGITSIPMPYKTCAMLR
ncbi:hypothetical protein E2320_020178, partial [Naja naja]